MITPVGVLTVEQIHQRKDDLLFSVDDVKALAVNEWNSAIEKFYREMGNKCDGSGKIAIVQIMQISEELVKSLDGGKK